MGMDQTFYITKREKIAPFIKNMRIFFKNTNYNDYDRYEKILSGIEIEEIGYARKNYFLHDLIVDTVPQASKENAGWTYLSLEDLVNCVKRAADNLIDGDYGVAEALILLAEIIAKIPDYVDDFADYGILYSADW